MPGPFSFDKIRVVPVTVFQFRRELNEPAAGENPYFDRY
ncbi:hypothetical protein KIS1582_1386 [Cytobacillus firmus]|uniref:Uncharacterized protein n=1 Tax=Cytobacillus firmus TaxID=1399 RepID=A0A800MYH4_CYTFI|nr:hypothetical protein KIS1582_1386 [Cytobacillus firmus]